MDNEAKFLFIIASYLEEEWADFCSFCEEEGIDESEVEKLFDHFKNKIEYGE